MQYRIVRCMSDGESKGSQQWFAHTVKDAEMFVRCKEVEDAKVRRQGFLAGVEVTYDIFAGLPIGQERFF